MGGRQGGIYDHRLSGPQFGAAPALRINSSSGPGTSAVMNSGLAVGFRPTLSILDYEVYKVTWHRDFRDELQSLEEIVPRLCKKAFVAMEFAAAADDSASRNLAAGERRIVP